MPDHINRKLRELYNKVYKKGNPSSMEILRSVRALVRLAEEKDPYTKKHSVKVSRYAVLLAKYVGLPKHQIERIRIASILHDIGKLGIDKHILLKRDTLTHKEYEEVKKHPEIGVKLLKPLKFFENIIPLVKHHHENYDGSGYPAGLKGSSIPFNARLLTIADVYDALTSKRAYRKAYISQEAVKIMQEDIEKKFDPVLLNAFFICLSLKGLTEKM